MHPRLTSKSVAKRDTTLRLLAAAHMSVVEYLMAGCDKPRVKIFVRSEVTRRSLGHPGLLTPLIDATAVLRTDIHLYSQDFESGYRNL
jgi:hypothetical protein